MPCRFLNLSNHPVDALKLSRSADCISVDVDGKGRET